MVARRKMSDMTDDKDLKEKQAAADTEADKAAGKDAADTASETKGNGDSEASADNADSAAAQSEAESSEETAETADKTAENADAEADSKAGADAAAAAEDSSAADTAASADGEQAGSDKTDKPDKKDKQIEELNDKYKRLFAEFDNFRKRTEAEKTSMFAEGERTVLLKVLPLIDNFERALDSIPEEQKETALAEGIDKTYKAFMAQLTELGVTPIDACGKGFDANLHNAVMHVEDDSVEDNIVVEEFQKGYMFKDKVLRYSMVKVAN